jgi:hypothetical protein
MDRMPGFVGRNQRTDLGEAIKKRIALFKVKNPDHHPREFFPHVSQLADQVKLAMENMNHARQDGAVLRGMSPLEKWAEDAPALRSIPDSAKWMYRSAMNVCKVTANGVRVTRGSGPKMMVYYWDNPEVLVPRQGQSVIVHWNDGNPEADAILRDARSRAFLCVARQVRPLARFNATSEELAAEANRKRAALMFARTEARAIQPELVRATVPLAVDQATEIIGGQIVAATARAERAETVCSCPQLPGAEGPAEIEPTNRMAALDNTIAPAGAEPANRVAARDSGKPCGGGLNEYTEVRGVRAAVRKVVKSFGGREFTAAEVRKEFPASLHSRVIAVLSVLKIEGELVKFKREDGTRIFKSASAPQMAAQVPRN